MSTLATSKGSARRRRAHSCSVDHDSSDGQAHCLQQGSGSHNHLHKPTEEPGNSRQHHHHHHHHHHNNNNSSKRTTSRVSTPASRARKNESDHKHSESDDVTPPVADDNAVELVRKIGQGSCGAVYLGRHPGTHRDYAVKLIPKDTHDQRTERLLQRVRLEGSLLLMLDHPHIVRGYGVVETDAHAFLFMDHAQGGDLLEFLNRGGALPEPKARLMFRQVVRAVRHLHRNGWVHRDIKPENIFIAFDDEEDVEGDGSIGHHPRDDDQGGHDSVDRRRSKDTGRANEKATAGSAHQKNRRVKLVLGDFGFARQWSPTKRMREFVGTFPYAAPEVLHRRKYFGPEVDVWSLGVVLLAMLTAQMPFGAPSEEVSRALAAAGHFSVPPHVSDAALDLLASTIQPDPALRITLDDLWRHPWMRMVDDVDTNTNSAASTKQSTNHKREKKRTEEDKKRKEESKEKEAKVLVPGEEDASTLAAGRRKRSKLRRAASLLFRRTSKAVGGKKKGRSTSAMASTASAVH